MIKTAKIIPIVAITYKEGLRSKVVYGIVVAAACLIFLSIFICGLYMRDLLKVLLDICLSAVSISGLLVPFFFSVHQLSGDIERRTIYSVLSRAVSRKDYIIGRFLGLAGLSGTLICITTLATFASVYGAQLVYPNNIFINYSPLSIVTCSIVLFLGIQILNSTVIFWCSITTSSFLATLLTISTYLIGHTLEDLIRFIQSQGSTVYVSPLIQKLLFVLQFVFPNLAAFDFKQYAAHGQTAAIQEISLLGVYSLTYCTIMLFLSVFFFTKRDL